MKTLSREVMAFRLSIALRPTYMDVGSAELRRERSRPTPRDESSLLTIH